MLARIFVVFASLTNVNFKLDFLIDIPEKTLHCCRKIFQYRAFGGLYGTTERCSWAVRRTLVPDIYQPDARRGLWSSKQRYFWPRRARFLRKGASLFVGFILFTNILRFEIQLAFINHAQKLPPNPAESVSSTLSWGHRLGSRQYLCRYSPSDFDQHQCRTNGAGILVFSPP